MKVLDHGQITIVDRMGSDLSVVRSARVSHDAAWRAGSEGGDKKLINYLWKNKHTTPFESVTFTFYIKAPIFVFRQWHRHRTQSYNEVSARYTELPEEFYIPSVDAVGIQSSDNKQGRNGAVDDVLLDRRDAQIATLKRQSEDAFRLYKELLLDNWPRELARCILPVNTYSKMFATMNLLNLFRFCTLRCDPHAQYEIREYASKMIELVKPFVPVCVEAWETYK